MRLRLAIWSISSCWCSANSAAVGSVTVLRSNATCDAESCPLSAACAMSGWVARNRPSRRSRVASVWDILAWDRSHAAMLNDPSTAQSPELFRRVAVRPIWVSRRWRWWRASSSPDSVCSTPFVVSELDVSTFPVYKNRSENAPESCKMGHANSR